MYATARNNGNFMRISALLLCGLACSLGPSLFASGQPRGMLLELHSCELYAGGCVVSSEATLGGRYLLRAWQFDGGSFGGSDLAGLEVALLQASSENLATANAEPGQAIVYLSSNANLAQRKALLDWVAAVEPKLKSSNVHTRTVPMQFTRIDNGYSFSAGDFVQVKTVSREVCETGACGEALWYSPRSPTSVFTVAVDRTSKVVDPLLQLKWSEAGKRNVFLAKFGENTLNKDVFVASADLCGPAAKLF